MASRGAYRTGYDAAGPCWQPRCRQKAEDANRQVSRVEHVETGARGMRIEEGCHPTTMDAFTPSLPARGIRSTSLRAACRCWPAHHVGLGRTVRPNDNPLARAACTL